MQNNKLLLGFKSVFLCVVVSLFLMGCVSEQVSGKEKKGLDKNRSLELHIQMALGYVDKGIVSRRATI